MTKRILWIAAVPVVAGVAIVAVGAMLPRDHVAAAEVRVAAAPADVAAMVREVERQPQWRSAVSSIEVLERGENRVRYVERSGGDAILFDLVEETGGRVFRSAIADPELPFGGLWIVTLTPEAGVTRVRVEEHGFVTNPVYRFFSALVFGHEATMRTYLDDLGRAVSAGPSEPSA
jgi:hypothetical protein